MRRLVFGGAWGLTFLLCALVMAQGYRLPEWVIDEGGVEARSSDYILNGSFHQTTIGYATGGNYIGWIGFWHPRPRWNGVHDVAAVRIIYPTGMIDTLNNITPKAELVNYGTESENFVAVFKIYMVGGVLPVYQNFKLVHLEAGESRIESFLSTRLHGLGSHIARCSVALATDANRENDTVSTVFKVLDHPPLPEGWSETDPIPAPPSGRGVKDGGWLTVDYETGAMFVSKGNKVPDFFVYDRTATPEWRELAPWQKGREGKYPGRGSVGCCASDGYVYATKGNNTLGFWRYNIYFDEWEQLPDVPYGQAHRKIKDGCDMVSVDRDGIPYIYLLKGRSNEFYRYNILNGIWEELALAPGSSKWYRGSWLVYDGENTIYAHKAKYHEFYSYDLNSGEWQSTPLLPMPIASEKMLSRKRAKEGSCGVWAYGSIFALKGGNTCEFWRYLPNGDSWVELDTMPSVGSSGRKKRVRDGGDITFSSDGVIYALKGNKTLEVWRFVPGAEIVNPVPPARTAVMAERNELSTNPRLEVRNPVGKGELRLRYSLGAAKRGRIELWDLTGRLVVAQTLADQEGEFSFGGSGRKSGVYFVRLLTGGRTLVEKAVFTP
ncbi:MAG: T9SS type A sorting domain-containing protein [bacterium]